MAKVRADAIVLLQHGLLILLPRFHSCQNENDSRVLWLYGLHIRWPPVLTPPMGTGGRALMLYFGWL